MVGWWWVNHASSLRWCVIHDTIGNDRHQHMWELWQISLMSALHSELSKGNTHRKNLEWRGWLRACKSFYPPTKLGFSHHLHTLLQWLVLQHNFSPITMVSAFYGFSPLSSIAMSTHCVSCNSQAIQLPVYLHSFFQLWCVSMQSQCQECQHVVSCVVETLHWIQKIVLL